MSLPSGDSRSVRAMGHKEAAVNGLGRVSLLLTIAGVTAGLIGCREHQPRRQPSMAPVPISDMKQVAGKWEGVSKRVPDMRDDSEVLLIIDDNGTFEFVGSRMTDMIVGAGRLMLRDGKLVGTTARLSATLTLHDREGTSVLIVEATHNDGSRYYGKLTPEK
jgi:hypothetical protein